MTNERKYKPLEELTLMDDYMFSAVMRNTPLLKPLLEYILDIRIAKLEFVEPQKSEKEGYASRGIRLDLYTEDEAGTIYSVEVQTTDKRNLPRRMRYYQSVIDIHVLNPGADYRNLRKSFTIFICNYDPFGKNRYMYTFENICKEDPEVRFADDTYKVVVNTKGTVGEISPMLREVIRYLDAGTVTGEYSKELNDAVNHVKHSEERRLEYMMMLAREMEIREEGREEGREETQISNIRNLMLYLRISAEKAMEMLGIPLSERNGYIALLESAQ